MRIRYRKGANPVKRFWNNINKPGSGLRPAGEAGIHRKSDEQKEDPHRRHVQGWMALAESEKVWQAETDPSGTGIVSRTPCKITNRASAFAGADSGTVEIRLSKGERMYVFPDDRILMVLGKRTEMISRKDLKVDFASERFVEDGPVPEDARVVDYAWRYKTRIGKMGRRYRVNYQLPVCLYGHIIISGAGLNVHLLVSNGEALKEFARLCAPSGAVPQNV